jgi:hypothetical protein
MPLAMSSLLNQASTRMQNLQCSVMKFIGGFHMLVSSRFEMNFQK